MKIVSWNVNSIRKGVSEALATLIEEQDPDIICFQETKGTEEAIEKAEHLNDVAETYPFRYYNDSVRGQAGVAIWSRIEPLDVLTNIPRLFQLKQGRVIVLEFEEFVLLNTYVPNTGREIAEQHRNVWHNSLMNWLPEQIDTKGFIWCGDLNVVRDPHLDTSHHDKRPTGSRIPPGLKQFEKDHLDEYLDLGLTDVFRSLNPELVSFTWFSNRNSSVGWRLDYFLVNEVIMEKTEEIIHGRKPGNSVSDHTWLLLNFKS